MAARGRERDDEQGHSAQHPKRLCEIAFIHTCT
jgi:hypothetical protein